MRTMTERLHQVIFRHLPSNTSKEAQASHRLARAIAEDVASEMKGIAR